MKAVYWCDKCDNLIAAYAKEHEGRLKFGKLFENYHASKMERQSKKVK